MSKHKHPAPIPETDLRKEFKELWSIVKQAGYPYKAEPDHEARVCMCGTCQEAFEEAMRYAEEQLRKDNCSAWLLSVAVGLKLMAETAYLRQITARPASDVEAADQMQTVLGTLGSQLAVLVPHPQNVERAWRTVEAIYEGTEITIPSGK